VVESVSQSICVNQQRETKQTGGHYTLHCKRGNERERERRKSVDRFSPAPQSKIDNKSAQNGRR